MENNIHEKIVTEFKNLIALTVADVQNEKCQKLHQAILETYFDAKNIDIDYERKVINLQIPVGENQYTRISFECLDIDGFLQSCLKKDQKSINYYQDLLRRYDMVSAA